MLQPDNEDQRQLDAIRKAPANVNAAPKSEKLARQIKSLILICDCFDWPQARAFLRACLLDVQSSLAKSKKNRISKIFYNQRGN